MALCNLSTSSGYVIKFVEERCLPPIIHLLISDCPVIRKNAMMIMCNLTCHDVLHDSVATQMDVSCMFNLMNDVNLETRAFATMTLCNLASTVDHRSAILDAGGMRPLLSMVNSPDDMSLQRAALLAIYNLSACESSHPLLAKNNVTQSIVTIITECPDVLCRRFALMILANVACNDKTRTAAVKRGGLQAAVISLKESNDTCRRLSCICLANMENDPATQSQIVVHGGLPALVTLCLLNDCETQNCAFICLGNIAANDLNHVPLMNQGAYNAFVRPLSLSSKRGGSTCITFGIANLTSNGDILSDIGRGGGIMPLITLAKSSNFHYNCLALSSLWRLSFVRENRDLLVADGIVETLIGACKTDVPEIQQEVASCFCNLSLAPNLRFSIAHLAMPELVFLTKCNDLGTVRLSLCVRGNLAEDIDTHATSTIEQL